MKSWPSFVILCFLPFLQESLSDTPITAATKGCKSGDDEYDNREFFCADEDCGEIKQCVDGQIMLSSCEQYADACIKLSNVYPFTEDPGCKLQESLVVKETCTDVEEYGGKDDDDDDDDDDNDDDGDDEKKSNKV